MQLITRIHLEQGCHPLFLQAEMISLILLPPVFLSRTKTLQGRDESDNNGGGQSDGEKTVWMVLVICCAMPTFPIVRENPIVNYCYNDYFCIK